MLLYQVYFKKKDSKKTWVKAIPAKNEEEARTKFLQENECQCIVGTRILGSVVR